MQKKRRKTKKSARRTKKTPSQTEVLGKALSHPVRVLALKILAERVASPKEISEVIGVRLTNVSYHMRVLDEFGLIEIMEEEDVRGSVAHFYRAVEHIKGSELSVQAFLAMLSIEFPPNAAH